MKSALPLLAVLLIVTAGCGGARPYRAMARAATSEEDVFAQVQDKELKIQLREALAARGESPLDITPYVYMERGFVVGFVGDGAQREGVLGAAQGVPGLRSLQSYLPDRPTTSSTANDVATKANVKAAFVPHREIGVTHVDIEVLAGHVVLLGVVGSEEARESAVTVATGVSGVKGVTTFLLLPEPGYESRRPHLR